MPVHTMTTRSRAHLSKVSQLDAIIEDINADLKDVTEKWITSSRKPELIELLRDQILAHAENLTPLDKAQCLGFGTFEPEGTGYGPEIRWYRCAQMVMFETILECLRVGCPRVFSRSGFYGS